jgi:cell division transport system permease protein
MTNAHRSPSTSSARGLRASLSRTETPIVPQDSIGGHALVAIIAIMTFLAALTTGAVLLVRASANEWQSDVAREMTIQLRVMPGRDIEADMQKAAAIARDFPGIADVRPLSKEESERLLEPWLGSGLNLDELPVPRVIVVKLAPGAQADIAGLRQRLAQQIPGASLDDHRSWVEQMRAMAGTAIASGVIVLALVLIATMLSVAFATRGAMAANRPVIEVLHLIGAKDSFIAGQFQRHFLWLGAKGGVAGGGAAILLFALAAFGSKWLAGGGSDQAALFGTFSLGPVGYAILALEIGLVALVTAGTCRRTVHQTLERM